METATKPVIGQNFSVDHAATITKPDGTTASAKDILCAEAPAAIMALQAAQALTQNWWLKSVISMVIGIINMLVGTFCQGTSAKA